MTLLLLVCVGVLGVAALLLVVRITLGPTMLDRVVGLDVLVAVIICGLALEAAVHQHTTTLPLLVVLAMLGFVGSVSVARISPGSDTVEDDESSGGSGPSGPSGAPGSSRSSRSSETGEARR